MLVGFLRNNSFFLKKQLRFFKQFIPTKQIISHLRLSTMRPEGVVDNWTCELTPEEVVTSTDDVINSVKNIYDTVTSVPDNEVSCDTILKVLNKAEWMSKTHAYKLQQMQHFVVSDNLRTASRDADKKFQSLNVELCMNQDVFKKLKVLKGKNEVLLPEYQRYLDRMILDGKRNGLHLDQQIQKEVKDLKNQINDLCVQFSTNIAEDSTVLEFSEEELIGMPKSFIENLEKSDSGKFKVTMQYPDYVPIMQNCRNPETRKAMSFAFNNRAKENKDILSKVLKLRHKTAALLGYPNHAAYVMEVLMSKNVETVKKFKSEIEKKMKPLFEEEKKYMLELKEKECKDLDIPFDGKLNPYDFTFYTTQVKEIKYAVDQKKLKEYFPINTVTKGLCDIYQTLLGVTFTKVENAEVWHQDVEMYKVTDTSSGVAMGYFFLDLYPRKGKYNHASAVELQPGCLTYEGKRQLAVAALLTNFSKPQKDTPSLLESSEVETYFHEFGHIMHYICAQPDLAFFEGFNVERDFIEAPSQMLENWCYEVEPLRKMSAHYSDQSPIPQDLLTSLTQSRVANSGYKTLRQIAFATFDLKLHLSDKVDDFDKAYAETFKEVMGMEPLEGTSSPCSFNHLCGGYDAQYYGYMWSEVYSFDMFDTCFRNGNVLNPEAGKKYREKILKPGGSKDAMDMLIDFLGREPTEDAFLRSKGVLKG